MSEPMTGERLTEIRRLLDGRCYSEPFIVRELVDEIDRLRAENARLRRFTEAMEQDLTITKWEAAQVAQGASKDGK